jgi:G3E family GTPase
VKLICGFLGAGKTTLVKNILTAGRGQEKTAVLVNDLGSTGIDGEIIRQTSNVQVLELPSGCICCSLKADLSTGITEIYEEYHPALLIIEPTGIATPSAILQTLREHSLRDKLVIEPVIGIIDPATFFDFAKNLQGFFMDQIVNSDILLINKMDLVPLKTGVAIEERLKKLNPSAIVYRTTYCKVELPAGRRERKEKRFIFESSFETLSYRTEKRFMAEEIEKLFSSFAGDSYGQIIRAKGIFRTWEGSFLMDYTPSNLVKTPHPESAETKVVIIGRGLNRPKIVQDLKVLEGAKK